MYYGTIPIYILRNNNITDGAKKIYCEITAGANEKGQYVYQTEELADMHNTPPKTITRWVNTLSDMGYIYKRALSKTTVVVSLNDNLDEFDITYELKGATQQKTNYAEFVKLTDEEYQKLVEKAGESGALKCIEILDNYKGSSGKKYASDYRAILNWVIDKYQKESKTEEKSFFELISERM